MAVTYHADVKNARMTATMNHFANGTLEIGTAGMGTVLAVFGLDAAGGSVAGSVWTLVLDDSTVLATGTGAAAAAQVKTSGGQAHITGLTVGTSGADLILSNTSLSVGQAVELTSAAINHAA